MTTTPDQREKPSLELLKRLANEAGGECLSDVYTGVLDRYDWRCSCGREWRASAAGLVYRGSFCTSCSRKRSWQQSAAKVTIDDARALATERGGEFLSPTFSTIADKHLWRCSCGNEWLAAYDKVKQGRWCPKCGRAKITAASSYTREDIAALAKTYGGLLLDPEYRGIEENHHFQCANGHVFRKRPSQLTKTNPLARNWCPKCSNGLNMAEEMCRAIVETAYGARFLSTFPGDWLVNARDRKMQLDGYNEKLRLAFEYQGHQHYEEVEHFRTTPEDLAQRIADDNEKAHLCAEHGIKLVHIPYFETVHLTCQKLIDHVSAAFDAAGDWLPPVLPEQVDRAIAVALSQPMKRLQDLATARGGEILSTTYLGMGSKYRWRCASGHEWEALASAINHGTWCPACVNRVTFTIERMHALAAERGGKCISTEYQNMNQPLHWECNCGNRWSAPPAKVAYDDLWCPKCSVHKSVTKAGAKLFELLRSEGFQPVSEYTGSMNPITFACTSGHQSRHLQADYVKRLLKRGELQCKECAASG